MEGCSPSHNLVLAQLGCENETISSIDALKGAEGKFMTLTAEQLEAEREKMLDTLKLEAPELYALFWDWVGEHGIASDPGEPLDRQWDADTILEAVTIARQSPMSLQIASRLLGSLDS